MEIFDQIDYPERLSKGEKFTERVSYAQKSVYELVRIGNTNAFELKQNDVILSNHTCYITPYYILKIDHKPFADPGGFECAEQSAFHFDSIEFLQ